MRKMCNIRNKVFICVLTILFCTFITRTETATESGLILEKTNRICKTDYSCQNGGECSENPEKFCECKQGTSGDYCDIIDECSQNKSRCGNHPDAECTYDVEAGKAKCHCKTYGNLFDEEKHKCRRPCRQYGYFCWNGGQCVNNFCECLPGTRGDNCRIVTACDTAAKNWKECGDPKEVLCEYNVTTHGHHCSCRIIDFFYDFYDRTCKACDCGKDGNCSFVKGNKTCDCKEGYAVNWFDYKFDFGNWGECHACECGDHSDGCTFQSSYEKTCNCSEGYSQNSVGVCQECDCGPNGKCQYDWRYKMCDCDEGFKVNDGICEACYCGPFGNCSFQNGEKKCTCQKGYAVDDSPFFAGKCRWCNCLDEKPINCSFSSGIKHCLCPNGFEQIEDNCIDIDECLNGDICPSDSVCENTPGSYECLCKDGYRPYEDDEIKKYGCLDIDECVESTPCPFTDTTKCLNLPGSYMCLCKEEYVPQSYMIDSEKEMGCTKDQSSWKYGYIALALSLVFICLGLLYGICRRYRNKP